MMSHKELLLHPKVVSRVTIEAVSSAAMSSQDLTSSTKTLSWNSSTLLDSKLTNAWTLNGQSKKERMQFCFHQAVPSSLWIQKTTSRRDFSSVTLPQSVALISLRTANSLHQHKRAKILSSESGTTQQPDVSQW